MSIKTYFEQRAENKQNQRKAEKQPGESTKKPAAAQLPAEDFYYSSWLSCGYGPGSVWFL